MRAALRTLAASVFLWTHAPSVVAAPPSLAPTPSQKTAVPPDAGIPLWAPCGREQAERWDAASDRDGRAALLAAACHAYLVERGGGDRKSQIEDARRGRKAAGIAVGAFPGSGVAHYLSAYLAGLEADRVPWRGLGLVSVIENEALMAAERNPRLDHAGPDRMLGELYLRAPSYPISVGNRGKALSHYRRAVTLDPDFIGNRLGLAEALAENDHRAEACDELSRLPREMPPGAEERPAWEKAYSLRDRLCAPAGMR